MRLYLSFIIFFAAIVFTNSISAQKINIEEAVMGQRSTLAPDRISGLQWIQATDCYSFIEEGNLIVKNSKGKLKKTISPSDISNGMTSETKRIPRVNWLNKNEFTFHSGNAYYKYNLKEKKSEVLRSHPEAAIALDYHESTGNLAYCIDNNLYVKSGDKDMPVTNEPEGVVSGQAIARYEFGITEGTFWSPDGSKLAFYQKDERHVQEYNLMDYTSTPAKGNTIKYPMAGSESEYASVGVFDANSGVTIYLKLWANAPNDDFYATNVSWSPDNKEVLVAIVNREQSEMNLTRFNATTGEKLGIIITEKDDKYIEPEHPAMFIPNRGTEFLWISEKGGFNNFYKYDISGKLIDKTKNQFPIRRFIGFNDEGTSAYYEATGGEAIDNHIFVLDIATMESKQISQESGYHRAIVNGSGKYIFDSWSSVDMPGTVDIISQTGTKIRNIMDSRNPLEGRVYGNTKVSTFEAPDGTELYYRLITPKNMDRSKKYPVLVYVYNGPHAQLVTNSWLGGASLWMHSMAAEGFIVFTVDGRGSAHRGKDFEQAIFRDAGAIEMQDQLAGVEFLKKLDYVDPDRMAVHGWSYGGFMTTSLMLRQPGTFKVGVAGGPVMDWNYYEVMYTERYMDTPEENPEGFKNTALRNYVTNLQGDLMIIHGTIDDVVVMQHSMDFIKHCVDEGVQVDFFPYPGHPHNVRGKDRVHLMKKVLEYIMEKI